MRKLIPSNEHDATAHERRRTRPRSRRLLFTLVAVVAVMAITGGATGAQAASVVTVTGSGSAPGVISSCGGSALRFTFEGTADLTFLGAVEISSQVCTDFTDQNPTTPILPGGTFTIFAAGGTLSGDVTGTGSNIIGPQGAPVHNVWTVTTGTGRFVGVSGSIEVDGFAQFPPSSFAGTFSGTLTLPSSTPQSKAECKKGGWRNLVSDQGHAFRNQGQCVSFVVSERR